MIINQRVWWDGLGAISHGLFSLLALRHPALAEAENIDIDHAVVLNLSCRMCTSYSPMKGSEKSTKSWRGPDPILMDHAPEGDIGPSWPSLGPFCHLIHNQRMLSSFWMHPFIFCDPHTAWKSVLGDWPKSYRTSHLSPTRAINCPVSFWGRPHAWYGCGHML